MSFLTNLFFPLLFLLFCVPSISTAETLCLACDIIEKNGGDALAELKGLSTEELSKTDSYGNTPFYWSIYDGHKKIAEFLTSKVKREKLISEEAATRLFSGCANNSSCPVENIDLLHSMKFKISGEALAVAVTGTQECSIEKFKTLKKYGVSANWKDKKGFNILHMIADRSRGGRPIFPRDCLITAIELTVKDRPDLLIEKNLDGLTPVQQAILYKKDKEFGSGVKAADLDPIIQALQPRSVEAPCKFNQHSKFGALNSYLKNFLLKEKALNGNHTFFVDSCSNGDTSSHPVYWVDGRSYFTLNWPAKSAQEFKNPKVEFLTNFNYHLLKDNASAPIDSPAGQYQYFAWAKEFLFEMAQKGIIVHVRND